MEQQVPGPICTSRVGDDWIDQGTLCLSQSVAPGSCKTLERIGCVTTGALSGAAEKAIFDREHVYSMAPEAAKKRAIDLQIIGGDYSRGGEISSKNEWYLKRLIELGSHHAQKVGVDGYGRLQFYIIRGGAEGFLPGDMAKKNAANFVTGGSTTGGATSNTSRCDENDLLVVFDKKGNLVSSARLERPLYIPPDDDFKGWYPGLANRVYDAWANKAVFIRKNTGYEIPYLGLGVVDGFRKQGTVVDLHKQEDTNGCILIVDPNTPDLDRKMDKAERVDKLGKFEPQLIKDVLAAIGKTTDDIKGEHFPLGIMRVVDIR